MTLPQYSVWFDRDVNRIDGALTFQVAQNGVTTKLYDRIPARSGQKGYTTTDWNVGESPMPFGAMLIRTRSQPLLMTPIGTPFFPICSDIRRPGVISDGRHVRQNCGLHLENEFPGTAGCVALVCDTPALRAQAYALFHHLESLQSQSLYIPFHVI